MKRLFFALVVTGVVGAPAPAHALRTQTAYDLTSADGVMDANDVGIAIFDLDRDLGPACRYYMQWIGPSSDETWMSLDCWVDEDKPHGGGDCFEDSVEAVPTVVEKAPSLPCTGFAGLDQIAPVLVLVLGESSDGSLYGVIQYSPASSLLDPLELDPYP